MLGHGDTVLVEKYSHLLYFESSAMILALVTVGKYLEARSKAKTSTPVAIMVGTGKAAEYGCLREGENRRIFDKYT